MQRSETQRPHALARTAMSRVCSHLTQESTDKKQAKRRISSLVHRVLKSVALRGKAVLCAITITAIVVVAWRAQTRMTESPWKAGAHRV
jgi:hypothetical protein